MEWYWDYFIGGKNVLWQTEFAQGLTRGKRER